MKILTSLFVLMAMAMPCATATGSCDGKRLAYVDDGHIEHPLGCCEGDCDKDSDCESGLKCFKRNRFQHVPGCSGSGKRGKDYCYIPEEPEPCQTIAEIAVGSNDFETLVAALVAADLVDVLADEDGGPFTVFAPTDDAFANLPDGLLDDLLCDTNALTDVLLYHVAAGAVFSGDLFDGQRIETLEGSRVKVSISGGTVKINDSKVIIPDIEACNGVVHVIDEVLVPPNLKINCDKGPPSDTCGGKRLKYVDDGHIEHPLGCCEGDCDHDDDCESGLKCFQRRRYQHVPGCSRSGKFGKDYCYNPDDH